MKLLVAGLAAAAVVLGSTRPETSMTVKRLTPILNVEAIEPCLPFWTERLGFALTTEVPDGDRLGFVILQKDGTELMYQTRASLGQDVPAVASQGRDGLLFIEVDDVDAVARALEGVDVVVPMRTTFYGAREIFVRAPCGTVVGFAEFGE